MYHDEMSRMVGEKVFAPQTLLTLAACVLCFIAIGYASWRVLARLPDFPYRREMLWGARWMWAVVAAVLGVAMGVTYYGAIHTDYPLTFIIAGGVVVSLGMGGVASLLPMQAAGWLSCFVALRARLRRERLDMAAWVTEQVRRHHKPWIRYIEVGGALAVLLMYAYLVLAYMYPFDRDFARFDREQQAADAVAADMRERLQEQTVVEIHAYGPMDLRSLDEVGTTRQAKRSLREMLALAGPPPPQEPFHLFIAVAPETRPQEGADMLEQARAVLAERKVTGNWQISVYVPESEVLARGEYP